MFSLRSSCFPLLLLRFSTWSLFGCWNSGHRHPALLICQVLPVSWTNPPKDCHHRFLHPFGILWTVGSPHSLVSALARGLPSYCSDHSAPLSFWSIPSKTLAAVFTCRFDENAQFGFLRSVTKITSSPWFLLAAILYSGRVKEWWQKEKS